MKPLLILRGIFGVLLLSIAACGPADTVGVTYQVKGKVTVDGKPATHGSVAFWPDSAKGNTSKLECIGIIAADGGYTMSTRGKPGVPPGAYKVTVAMQTKVESTEPDKAVLEVPKEYTTKEKTPLTIEVVEKAAAGAYDLKVGK